MGLLTAEYKSATNVFLKWLGIDPTSSKEKQAATPVIWRAVEAACQSKRKLPMRVFNCLNTAIHLREETHRQYQSMRLGGANPQDVSHRYFIEGLKVARKKIRPLLEAQRPTTSSDGSRKQQQSKKVKPARGSNEEKLQNMFARLNIEDITTASDYAESDALSDEEWRLWQSGLEDESPEQTVSLLVDEHRTIASLLLRDMFNLMDSVGKAWKDCSSRIATEKDLTCLATAGAVTNECIAEVSRLWAEVTATDLPFVETMHDVLVVITIPDVINDLITDNPKNIDIRTAVHMGRLALGLSAFASKMDGKFETAVKKIAQLGKLSRQKCQDFVSLAALKIMTGAQALFESPKNSEYVRDRMSIGRTSALVESFVAVIPADDKTTLVCKEGFFGPLWDEKKNPASTTGDLTSWLFAEVLPTFYTSIILIHDKRRRLEPIGRFKELHPVWALMNEFFTTRLVSLPLVFGIHAMLVAQLLMQGQVTWTMKQTKASLNRLKSQIEAKNKTPECDAPHLARDQRNLIEELEWLIDRGVGSGKWDGVMRVPGRSDVLDLNKTVPKAFWNPLECAQTLLFSNVQYAHYVGSGNIGSSAQERLTIHLYNAFLRIGAIPEPIPLLEKLSTALGKSGSTLCNGSLPTDRGRFTSAFLLAFGFTASSANLYRSVMAKDRTRENFRHIMKKIQGSQYGLIRWKELVPYDTDKISESYRRCVTRDFEDVKEKGVLDRLEKVFLSTEDDEMFGINMWALGQLMHDLMFHSLVSALDFGEMIQEQVRLSPHSDDSSRVYTVQALSMILADCDNTEEGGELPERVRVAADTIVKGVAEWSEEAYKFTQIDASIANPIGPAAGGSRGGGVLASSGSGSDSVNASSGSDDNECAQCGKRGVKLFKCSACQSVRYCAQKCQKVHWKAGHRKRCSKLKEAHEASEALKEQMRQSAEEHSGASIPDRFGPSSQYLPEICNAEVRGDSSDSDSDDDLPGEDYYPIERKLHASIPQAPYQLFGQAPGKWNRMMASIPSANVMINPLLNSYPAMRNGQSPYTPLIGILHLKKSKRGRHKSRSLVPGPLTPFVMDINESHPPKEDNRALYAVTPYRDTGSKLVQQPNGKHRHIADYTLLELMELGWDGAKYFSQGDHAANGLYCPFVCGYDSDSDDEYDEINVQRGIGAGTVGLDREVGLYLQTAMSGTPQLIQLKRNPNPNTTAGGSKKSKHKKKK